MNSKLLMVYYFKNIDTKYVCKAAEIGCSIEWARFLAKWFLLEDIKDTILVKAQVYEDLYKPNKYI